MIHDRPPSPLVVVIAGPNGAGKSTTAPRLLQGTLAVAEFVNADSIALGLSAFRPESVALAAGRVMLARINHLAAARADFAFETTPGRKQLRRPARRVGGFRLSGTPGVSIPAQPGDGHRAGGRTRGAGRA